MDPFSRRGGVNEACMLFVPTVKDSRVCGVCRFSLSDHPRTPFFFLGSSNPSIYASPADLPRNATITPITKPLPFRSDTNLSPNMLPSQVPEKPVLSRSETSAFSQYTKNSADGNYSPLSDASFSPQESGNSTDESGRENRFNVRKCNTFNASTPILKPKPRYATKYIGNDVTTANDCTNSENSDERPPSRVFRKIKAKQKERSSSTSRTLQASPRIDPSQSESFNAHAANREIVPRARNFKQILDRFQNASDRVMREHSVRANGRARDPTRRYTVDAITFGKSFDYDANLSNKSFSDSFHDESDDVFAKHKLQSPPSLTISIPALKTNVRHALPERWMDVKETDIDEIPATPVFSDHSTPPPAPKSFAVMRNGSASELLHKVKQHSKLGGSCRRALSGIVVENGCKESVRLRDPTARIFARNRTPSQPEMTRIENLPLADKKGASRRSSMTLSMPISDERVLESPVPCPPSPSRSMRGLSPSSRPPPTPVTSDRAHTVEEAHTQMMLNQTEVLAFAAEHLPEYVRIRDEPLTKNRLNQLKFGDIVFKSFTPTLIKGSILFFDALLPRPGLSNCETTIMIAPASQYFPLSVSRRAPSVSLWCPPVLAEIDDAQGEVRRFLQDSSHLAGRLVKVSIMPRLSLLSFHSLAAHNLYKSMKAEEYERHVCFIMMQLVCALKSLQSDGVESLSNNFREFLLAYRYTNFNPPVHVSEFPRILLLHEAIGEELDDANRDAVGVCRYALRALCTLLHHKMDNNVPLITHRSSFSDALLMCAELLHQEKSSSLTEAKNALEYSFWVGCETVFDNEFEAKVWLDSQRAHEVNHLLRSLIDGSTSIAETHERLHLQFLLSVTPRSLFKSSEAMRKSFV